MITYDTAYDCGYRDAMAGKRFDERFGYDDMCHAYENCYEDGSMAAKEMQS